LTSDVNKKRFELSFGEKREAPLHRATSEKVISATARNRVGNSDCSASKNQNSNPSLKPNKTIDFKRGSFGLQNQEKGTL
jgi:hypothetical protein